MMYWRTNYPNTDDRRAARIALKKEMANSVSSSVQERWQKVHEARFEKIRRSWLKAVIERAEKAREIATRKWWSLPEAIAWICYRDHGRAIAALDDGQYASPLRLSSRVNLMQQYEPEHAITRSVAATENLWKALQSEQVTANGIPSRSDNAEARTINSYEWERAKPPGDSYLEIFDHENRSIFRNVLVSSEDLLRAFPPRESLCSGSVNPIAGAVEKTSEVGNAGIQSKRGGKVGAPPKYDWEEYERVLSQRLKEIGQPSLQNEEGWRNNSDVARWIMDLSAKDKIDMPFETAKDWFRKFSRREG